jgi:hypothetical protein
VSVRWLLPRRRPTATFSPLPRAPQDYCAHQSQDEISQNRHHRPQGDRQDLAPHHNRRVYSLAPLEAGMILPVPDPNRKDRNDAPPGLLTAPQAGVV